MRAYRLVFAFVGTFLTAGWNSVILAADPPDPVAATVGDTPVHASAVQRAVQAAVQGRETTPQTLSVLQAQALEQLIGRKLIERRMAEQKELVADFEVAQALEAMQGKLKEQGITWEALLAQRKLTEADVKAELIWELSWKKYLTKNVNDAALEAYFKAHRRELDGTKLGVSHILLRPVNSSPEAAAETIKQAETLHSQLKSKKLEFADAAKAYSAGPSREQGGDLGFIPRQGVMDETFAKAAFELEVGEISPPVRTRFGIHLIRVTKVQPGDKKWTDVREQLLQPLAQETFQKLVQTEREKTSVRYTGATPYIRPGTQQVVLPGG